MNTEKIKEYFSENTKKKYKKINIMYSFIVISYVICEGFFGYAFTAFMSNRGLNISEIGLLMGLTNFSIMLFDYPSGNIADKYGRKKICSIGFIIYGIGLIIFGISKNFIIFLISGITRAMGSSLISGTPTAWYLGELSKENGYEYKDRFLPVIRGISLLFGSASGIIAGNLSKIEISIPIHLGGSIMIISGIIIMIFFKENYGKSDNSGLPKVIIKNTVNFLKNSSMRVLSIFELLKTVTFTIFILSWQIFAVNVIGVSYNKLGYFYTAMLLLMSFSSFFSGFLMKKINSVRVTILGLIFLSIGLTLFITSRNIYIFVIAFFIFEFSLGMVNTSYYTWLYDYIPKEVTASYSSALNSIQAFAGFLMSILIGKVVQRFGYTKSWIIAIIASLIAAIWLLKIYKKGGSHKIN